MNIAINRARETRIMEKAVRDFRWLSSLLVSVLLVSGLVQPVQGADISPESLPRYVAVLPALGDGTEGERNDLHLAVNNALGASNFELLKPASTQQLLETIFLDESLTLETMPAKQLAERLRVDGLIYVEMVEISKIYVAAYAQYKVAIRIKFYSLQHDRIIWEHEDSETEREGGISADPLSFLATAISSSRILTDAVRLQLTDVLARRFAKKVPQPQALFAKAKPPEIVSALSNASEGPFTSGDEIRVLVEAEPNLNIEFQLSNSDRLWPLSEQSTKKSGELSAAAKAHKSPLRRYTGRFVVPKGLNVDEAQISLQVQRGREKPITWLVPGRVVIDTRPPKPVTSLNALPQANLVQLTWQSQGDESAQEKYMIERALKKSGKFNRLAIIELTEFEDDTLEPGNAYRYRVTPIDPAGNRGRSSTVQVETLRYGPTSIDKDIGQNVFYKAAGSPYQISGAVNILKDVKVEFEPGSVIEFMPESSLTVLGSITAKGRPSEPIIVKGNRWQINHTLPSPSLSLYDHIHFRADANSVEGEKKPSEGLIRLQQARVELGNCTLTGVQLQLQQGADAKVSKCHFQQASVAVALHRGKLSVKDSRFVDNQLALDNHSANADISKSEFAGNQRHIQTQAPLKLSGVSFPKDDFIGLQQRLQGHVEIDWGSLPESQNLQAQWLQTLWIQTTEAIAEQDWRSARKRLSQASKVMADPRFEDLIESLYLLQNPAARAPDIKNPRLLSSILKLREQGKRARLVWLPLESFEQHKSFTLSYLHYYHAKLMADGILRVDPTALEPAMLLREEIGEGIDHDLGALFLVDEDMMQVRLKNLGFIRQPPLLKSLQLVKPARKQLCNSAGPWAYGEQAVDGANPIDDDGCLSLRVTAARDLDLYLFAGNQMGQFVQILPDQCQETGVLSNRVTAQQTLAVPQNNNQQPTVAQRREWPYTHFFAVGLADASASRYLAPILSQSSALCQTSQNGEKASLKQIQQLLYIADKRSGGNLQWMMTAGGAVPPQAQE
jgi:hypothetical protein